MRHRTFRCARPHRWVATLAFLPLATFARAADEHPFCIKGARILVGDGQVIESGSILVRAGKIQELGATIAIPADATVMDGAGKTVTPGFIDARSVLLLDDDAVVAGGSDAYRLSADAVDRYATNAIKEALENGVTSIALAPTSGLGIAGRGAVVKLKPDRAQVLSDHAFLAINLEPWEDLRPVNTLRELLEVKKAFEDAKKYREQWQTYEQDLEEYLKKVKEQEEKEKAGQAKPGEKKDEGKKPEEKPKEEKKDEKKEPEKKDEPPPKKHTDESFLDEWADLMGDDGWFQEEKKPAPAPEGEKKAEGEQKDEKLKKPERPAKDEAKEILLQALDRKLPVFFGAQRAEAIQEALDLIAELNLRGVIAGGERARDLAPALAKAGVPVILGPVQRAEAPAASCFRGHDPLTAVSLERAKVTIVLASTGDDPHETRFLPLTCAAAIGTGVRDRTALASVTVRAASVLGVQDRIGKIASGKDADLLVFGGDPFAAGSLPLTVMVDGQIVAQR